MIGRLHHVVVDCPDPLALATFYSRLLGLPITFNSGDWVVISASDTASGIAFQSCSEFQAPRWPDPEWPQQLHLDVMVDDLDEAEIRVIELGAKKISADDRVFSDPAGHPFCLVNRPLWAPPIEA
jgi:catechol 2,3-dioxygenase-like lactoylglutathione lyase family enzyme